MDARKLKTVKILKTGTKLIHIYLQWLQLTYSWWQI